MIKQQTFLYLLKVYGYRIEVISGRIIKITHSMTAEVAFLPVQYYYSWLRLRILIMLNSHVFPFNPKIQILKWKLHLAVNKLHKSLKRK